MNRTVEKSKTLLVDGPASVIVVSGKVEVFGSKVSNGSKIVIREGKRIPFAVEENAVFETSLAEKGNAEEVGENTIPSSWAESYEELSNIQTRPVTAMVLGAVDSGKTSFCTYLINRLVGQKKRIAVLDGDLGQSDIGPPCTIAYAFITKPLTDLFNLRAKNAVFIGATSPSGVIDKMIDGMTSLQREILHSSPDFVIVNCDGWIEGEEAIKYKILLVEAIKPDLIFYIQQKGESTPLMDALEKYRKIIVDSSSVIDQRSRERRKNLRELGYLKYLRNAKVQSYPIGWLKIEDNELFGLSRTHLEGKETQRIYALLGMKPLQIVERGDRISIIIGKRRWIDAENLKKVEQITKKKVAVVRKGEEEGLLAAFYNTDRGFLGIGVLQEIDFLRRTLKILSPVHEDVAIASIGEVKLDKNMKEIPAFGEEEQTEPNTFSKLF